MNLADLPLFCKFRVVSLDPYPIPPSRILTPVILLSVMIGLISAKSPVGLKMLISESSRYPLPEARI